MAAFINGHQALWICLCWSALTLAVAAGAGWLWAEWRAGARQLVRHRAWQGAFLGLLMLAVISFRQPTIWRSECQQIDAVAVLVAVQMLEADSVPFRGCTIGIHGPLGAYLLMPLHWLGQPLTPATARWFALITMLVLIATTGMVAARYGGAGAAVPATLAVGLWAAFAKELDFCEWNSEYPPVAAMAIAVLAFAVGRQPLRRPVPYVYTAGLLLGSVPYCKLQPVPLALLLTAIGCLDLSRSATWQGRRGRGWCAFVAGGMTLPVTFTAVALVTGTWTDFINHYFGFALAYGSYRTFPWAALGQSLSGFDLPWFLAYLSLVTGVLLALAGRWWQSLPRAYWFWVAAAGAQVALVCYSVGTARMGYHHYAILLIAPAAWLCALITGPTWQALCRAERPAGYWRVLGVAGAWSLALGCWSTLYMWGAALQISPAGQWSLVHRPQPHAVLYLPIDTTHTLFNEPTSRIAQRIIQAARPTDRLAIWGWAPYYFLETGLPNATRYIMTAAQMSPNLWVDIPPPLAAFFRQRFLQDLQQQRPAWVIDAVSGYEFGFQDRARFGHENWPALAEMIATDYVLFCELQVAPDDGTRVYLRRDLASARLGSHPGASLPASHAP